MRAGHSGTPALIAARRARAAKIAEKQRAEAEKTAAVEARPEPASSPSSRDRSRAGKRRR